MKENELTSHDEQEALALRLQERALLTPASSPARDRLVLADATLLAALAGTRLLTPNERTALAASPLTLRRFRQLSLQGRAAGWSASANSALEVSANAALSENANAALEVSANAKSNDHANSNSLGGNTSTSSTTKAASAIATGNSTAPVAANDANWCGSTGMLRAASTAADALASLVTDDNCWTLHFVAQDGGWQVILALSAQAPFAARLLGEQPLLRVIDGSGATVLQGRLDADGECECAWPFATAPAPHFQLHGANFTVQPAPPVAL